MLLTFGIFLVVSILMETYILRMFTTKEFRETKTFRFVNFGFTMVMVLVNGWVGFGSVSGMIQAKLAFLAGVISPYIIHFMDKGLPKLPSFGDLKLRLYKLAA